MTSSPIKTSPITRNGNKRPDDEQPDSRQHSGPSTGRTRVKVRPAVNGVERCRRCGSLSAVCRRTGKTTTTPQTVAEAKDSVSLYLPFFLSLSLTHTRAHSSFACLEPLLPLPISPCRSLRLPICTVSWCSTINRGSRAYRTWKDGWRVLGTALVCACWSS